MTWRAWWSSSPAAHPDTPTCCVRNDGMPPKINLGHLALATSLPYGNLILLALAQLVRIRATSDHHSFLVTSHYCPVTLTHGWRSQFSALPAPKGHMKVRSCSCFYAPASVIARRQRPPCLVVQE
nr:hypothetical protein CFP56_21090 [Quercus suber]